MMEEHANIVDGESSIYDHINTILTARNQLQFDSRWCDTWMKIEITKKRKYITSFTPSFFSFNKLKGSRLEPYIPHWAPALI
jgi:hypothetical protein